MIAKETATYLLRKGEGCDTKTTTAGITTRGIWMQAGGKRITAAKTTQKVQNKAKKKRHCMTEEHDERVNGA